MQAEAERQVEKHENSKTIDHRTSGGCFESEHADGVQGSDKITGTAKNWSLSNTGKVLRERESYPWNGEANDVRILRYTTAGSEEKYAIVSFGQYQGGAFVGTKTAAYQMVITMAVIVAE